MTIDPLAIEYPYYSTYSFSGNRVIDCYELEGAEPMKDNDGKTNDDFKPAFKMYLPKGEYIIIYKHGNSLAITDLDRSTVQSYKQFTVTANKYGQSVSNIQEGRTGINLHLFENGIPNDVGGKRYMFDNIIISGPNEIDKISERHANFGISMITSSYFLSDKERNGYSNDNHSNVAVVKSVMAIDRCLEGIMSENAKNEILSIDIKYQSNLMSDNAKNDLFKFKQSMENQNPGIKVNLIAITEGTSIIPNDISVKFKNVDEKQKVIEPIND